MSSQILCCSSAPTVSNPTSPLYPDSRHIPKVKTDKVIIIIKIILILPPVHSGSWQCDPLERLERTGCIWLWDHRKALYLSIKRFNVRSSVNLSNLAVNVFLNWLYFAVTAKKSILQKRVNHSYCPS